jgi:hypothetical protein
MLEDGQQRLGTGGIPARSCALVQPAILALLYGSGLRRAEAVGLDVSDYDREAGTLKVRGKGNKERLAHRGDASQAALEAWFSHRGFWPGAVFVSINKGGKLRRRGMSGQAMLYIAAAAPSRPALRPSRRTTCGAPSSAICSMPAPTSAPSSSSRPTLRFRRPPAMTAAARPPRKARPSSSTRRTAGDNVDHPLYLAVKCGRSRNGYSSRAHREKPHLDP